MRRKRPRRFSARFALLASAIAVVMLVGLVSLSALVAQTSYRIDDLSSRITQLSMHRDVLGRNVAEASAPGRIARWAHQHGMRLPDVPVILHVPGPASSNPAGEADPARGGIPGSGPRGRGE